MERRGFSMGFANGSWDDEDDFDYENAYNPTPDWMEEDVDEEEEVSKVVYIGGRVIRRD
jgi:hypothetical protein